MKIYQTKDLDGTEKTWMGIRPHLINDSYYNVSIHGYDYYTFLLFPIVLKPCQIAEIIIYDGGTWKSKIERVDGWYVAKKKDSIANVYDYPYFFQYENGKFFVDRREVLNIDKFIISNEPLPNEYFKMI